MNQCAEYKVNQRVEKFDRDYKKVLTEYPDYYMDQQFRKSI